MKISLKIFKQTNDLFRLNIFRFIVSGSEYQVRLFLTGVCCSGILFSCQNLYAQPFKNLVWSDEFNKPGLPDSTHWEYDLGTGNNGWGNNELQYYTNRPQNVRVENGMLVIEAKEESYANASHTSSRLISKKSGNWKYGRIEVNAKIPIGRGLWPAIWMMPAGSVYGSWPKSGEIDIMENVGFKPDSLHSTVHTYLYNGGKGTQKGSVVSRNDLKEAFHMYAVEWTADLITFFVDNEKVFEYRNEQKGFESWPFDQEFYLILNVAVGGHWGGTNGVDNMAFPATMLVDYVRVYQ